MRLLPKKVFFVTGVGTHREHLESFEKALRDAGIEKFNLVTVTSILPPNCEIIAKDTGLNQLLPGEIVFCVMSRLASNEPNRRISASLGSQFLRILMSLAIFRSTTHLASRQRAQAPTLRDWRRVCTRQGPTLSRRKRLTLLQLRLLAPTACGLLSCQSQFFVAIKTSKRRAKNVNSS